MIRSLLPLALVAGGCFRSPPSAEPTGPLAPPMKPMAFIKGGTFEMGTAGITGDDLDWSHQETVPDFHIDVTEVTVRAYRRCVEAGKCRYEPHGPQCNMERDGFDDDPVNCVSWHDAVAYCSDRTSGSRGPTPTLSWSTAYQGRGRVRAIAIWASWSSRSPSFTPRRSHSLPCAS